MAEEHERENENERRCCIHCAAPLPPIPPPPPPLRSRAKVAERKAYSRALDRRALAARSFCNRCALIEASRADDRKLFALGLRPLSAAERERVALPAEWVVPRKPRRERSPRTIARDLKLYAEAMAEMAEDFRLLRGEAETTETDTDTTDLQ
jgi:hypothetical protein